MDEAIALSRISSDGQSMGHSLEAQQESVSRVANDLGVKLVKTWSEVQSSKKGKNFGRKDLEEMLAYCKQNKRVKYVLVDMVNRLMREMKVMVYYLVRFEQEKVKVYFCDPSQQYLNRDDQLSQLLVIIEGFSAEQDNASRRNTTIARMKTRYAAGYYISHPHQGYMKSEIAGLHMPDPVRFELLQKCCRLIIYQQYTLPRAVQYINEAGYRTIGGKKLSVNHFAEFIVNGYYCGKIDIKFDGLPLKADGLHQPMLSQKEHKLLISILKKRNPKIRQQHNAEFMLSNLLRHKECAGQGGYEKFTGHQRNPGKQPNGNQKPLIPVYDCRDCRKRIRRDKIHESFTNFLNSLEFIPSKERFRKALIKTWGNERGSVTQRLAVLKTNKANLEQKVKETAIAYAQEPQGFAKNALHTVLQDYDKQLTELEVNITSVQTVDMESEDFVSFAIDFVDKLRDKWWNLSWENMKRGEQILFNGKIYADNSANVHPPLLSSIYRLGTNKKALSNVDNAHLVELPDTASGSVSVPVSLLQA